MPKKKSNKSEWGNRRLFWFETWRSIILGISGGFLVLLVMDPYGAKSDYQAEIDKGALEKRGEIINEFLKFSYSYTSELYNTCNGAEADSSILDSALQPAYDNYRNSRNQLLVYFSNKPEIYRLDSLAGLEFKCLKEYYWYCPKEKEHWRDHWKEGKRLNNEVSKIALTETGIIGSDSACGWLCRLSAFLNPNKN